MEQLSNDKKIFFIKIFFTFNQLEKINEVSVNFHVVGMMIPCAHTLTKKKQKKRRFSHQKQVDFLPITCVRRLVCSSFSTSAINPSPESRGIAAWVVPERGVAVSRLLTYQRTLTHMYTCPVHSYIPAPHCWTC